MGKKRYCGNLSCEISSTDLEQARSWHGTVLSVNIIMDRTSGRSNGFGFVEMTSEVEAQAVIHALKAQEHFGRMLVVSEAKPRQPLVDGKGRHHG
ncbi:MAG: RNA-binding protein [Planctomycetes bacterium]|nr:RNA-binding protein [Planctomycetota bacterium]